MEAHTSVRSACPWIGKNLVEGEIISEELTSGEPRNHLSLYIALTQRAKFEWILQKGTELGVSTFIPVITSRSLVRETAGDARKVERWESILREAAEQCARGRIPEVLPALSFEQALTDAKKRNELCLFAWEKETSWKFERRAFPSWIIAIRYRLLR